MKWESELKLIKEDVRNVYAELGKTYYKYYKNAAVPGDAIKEYIEEIDKKLAAAEDVKQKMDELREQPRCLACGSPVKRDIMFCPNCGNCLVGEPKEPNEHPMPAETQKQENIRILPEPWSKGCLWFPVLS